MEALVFGDSTEYDAVAGRGSAGKFLPGLGATGSLLIVRHSESPTALDSVVAHELAHRFVDAAHPALPNWLDEGLASYLESADVRGDEVRFGAATRRSIHGFQAAGGVSFAALVRVAPEKPLRKRGVLLLLGRLGARPFPDERPRRRPPPPGRRAAGCGGSGHPARVESAEGAFTDVYPDVTAAELDDAIERLTRSLGRPAVDVILSMRFQRPPERAIERRRGRRPAGPRAHGGRAQRRSRWRTPEPGSIWRNAPTCCGPDAEISFERPGTSASPTATCFSAPFAWELDLGFGSLGYQLGAMARGHVVVGQGGNFFVSAGVGPMLAFKSRWLGNEILPVAGAAKRGLYYLLGLHPEIAAEIRTPSNVLVRVSVGAYLSLAENFTPCGPPVPPSEEPACPAGAVGTRIAREGRDVFVRVGIGYTW